jgi:hypothetical protein
MFLSSESPCILGFYVLSALAGSRIAVVAVTFGRRRATGLIVYADLTILAIFVYLGSSATERRSFVVTVAGYPLC